MPSIRINHHQHQSQPNHLHPLHPRLNIALDKTSAIAPTVAGSNLVSAHSLPARKARAM